MFYRALHNPSSHHFCENKQIRPLFRSLSYGLYPPTPPPPKLPFVVIGVILFYIITRRM